MANGCSKNSLKKEESLLKEIDFFMQLYSKGYSVQYFPKKLEYLFQKRYHEITGGTAQLTLVLGLIAFVGSCIFDLFFIPNGTTTIKIRLFIVSPVLFLLFLLSFTPVYAKYQQIIIILFAVIIAAGLAVIAAVIPAGMKDIMYQSLMLCALFVTALARLQFRYSLFVLAIVMLLFNISYRYSGMQFSSLYYWSFYANNYDLIFGVTLCVIASYFNEVNIRKQYITDCLVEKKAERNILLLERLTEANALLNQEIIEHKQAKERVIELSNDLVLASRSAGMSDIATSALHNIGNVLNSINTSVVLIREKNMKSELGNLIKTINLLDQHRTDIIAFLAQDEQGKDIVNLWFLLSKAIISEKNYITGEMISVEKNVQYIKDILSMQQSLSTRIGVIEETSIEQLLEDALTLGKTSYQKSGITIIREFSDLPKVVIDRVKLMQVLVNLIKNAVDSLLECKVHKKILKLCLRNEDNFSFMIKIIDNGVGISTEHSPQIFNYGFTTKLHGHGFGLHSSASSIKEMGGHLSMESDGVNKGATCTLVLPYKPEVKGNNYAKN